ncbi:sodium/proton-translocating pyrophosphatase [Streptomyces camelliae]|uniref:Sodium/proton-translocating pyrophosphatase n=1 Tax=Streptomyces camelliae TaxID=3004093 RepID=A0ABY7NXZ8_9ACTN|nr:sodium/proton-translocating pyrophosphatase [Streptomyces sp. HUAS 2-6]WBO62200.1 sodium/proton-translocating pyrophosphatase [Streptomyces sp. HUAS 2-6]
MHAATALFGGFRTAVEDSLAEVGRAPTSFSLSVDKPNALVGLLLDAAAVFLFTAPAVMAVGRSAGRAGTEVREQFRTTSAIMEGTELPDCARVVDISTADALRERATPALLAAMAPIAVECALGYTPLGTYQAGAIATGALIAVFLAGSGAAVLLRTQPLSSGNTRLRTFTRPGNVIRHCSRWRSGRTA